MDFHELTSVLQTNLMEKTDLKCGEESVDHRRPASQRSLAQLDQYLFNIILSELIEKNPNRRDKIMDFIQYEKLRNGNLF